MCGIAGFINCRGATQDASQASLQAMTDAIRNRGPDDAGMFLDVDSRLGLGHRRLSIVDLSPAGHQPMLSADGRFIIVFNGEIYNHAEQRQDLIGEGCKFRGHSDTEVLLTGIAEWGLKRAVERSVGMFAFALWDKATQSLSLCVDRMGEKPLYYGWCGRTFLFGSELKALCAHPAWEGKLNLVAVAHYMGRGWIQAPHSIYQGIFKLEPGTIFQLSLQQAVPGHLPQPARYWSVEEAYQAGQRNAFPGSEVEAVDELERLLKSAVGIQMVADVPVGAFLSGGIDSSIIVALMQAQSKRPVHTFSVGFAEAGFNEAEQARGVATHLRTEHTEIMVSARDALEIVPKLSSIYDEPFADSSQIPTYLVAALARQKVKVSLSGDAGDELFLGYKTYQHLRRVWGASGWLPGVCRRGIAHGLSSLSNACWAMGALGSEHRTRLSKLIRVLPAQSPQLMHQLLTTLDAERVLSPELKQVACLESSAGVMASYAQQNWLTELGVRDLASYLPNDILVKVDRAAMAVSLETRIPLLDHRIVEFALSLSDSMKIKSGQGKWVLRQVLYRHVPRALVERPKSGFSIPLSAWLRGPLREWAQPLLDESSLEASGAFDPRQVQHLWHEHLSGRYDNSSLLYTIAIFQSWLKTSFR